MSHQHWELLAKITTAQLTDLPTVCQGLARESEAERLFCVVSTPHSEEVLALDCDGYPLGFAAERLADGGLSDLVFRFGNELPALSEPQVTRRVSRASKRTVIAGKIGVRSELAVSVILENRFAGEGLANFDDGQVVRWLIIVALVVRLNAARESAGRQPLTMSDASPKRPPTNGTTARSQPVAGGRMEHQADIGADPAQVPAEEEQKRADTLGALHQEQWNISRAARRLGMTRHGLKKRMRRLSLLKTS